MKSTTEFPKRMVHPAGQRGTATPIPGSEVYGPNGNVKYVDYQGTPDRFPPIDARDLDEEEQYRAKGYLPYGEQAVSVIAFLEYPKMMVHPDHEDAAPAFAAVTNGGGQVTSPAVPGRPAKFPDLTVHTEEEEFAAVAKGYRLPGKSDPDAVQAAISSPHDPSRVTREYPKIVNGKLVHDPSVNRASVQEYPKWVGDVLVNSRAEEEAITGPKPAETTVDPAEAKRLKKAELQAQLAALDEGADDDPPTPAAAPPQPAPPAPEAQTLAPEQAERPALYAELTRRSITFSNRWSTDRLRKALEQSAAA